MPRKPDPQSPYRVSIHKLGKYTYASTQPTSVDPDTGKRTNRHIHWGKYDPQTHKFFPNMTFLSLSQEERNKLIFPEDWDLAEIDYGIDKQESFYHHQVQPKEKLYGDIWFLEQIIDKLGIQEDLMNVFNENKEIVDMIITIAIFSYVTKYSLNRLSRWQSINYAPSKMILTPSIITRLTQKITNEHRNKLFNLRKNRINKNALCAVDSTTRAAYGDSLADVKWGKSKDRPDLPQTIEVVVYSLTDHQPIFYRTFPGNIPDSRTFITIIKELRSCGFNNFVIITDRGYETIENIEFAVQEKIPLISAAPINRKMISKKINDFGEFSVRPQEMEFDINNKVYYKQYNEIYEVKINEDSSIKSDKFKINIYLDSELRARLQTEQDLQISVERLSLNEYFEKNIEIKDIEKFKNSFSYHDVEIENGKLKFFNLKNNKIKKENCKFGFFSIITNGLDHDASTALEEYCLRDEQEKYYFQMKDVMDCKTQRNWSEDGKTGRLFILFIGLILSSHVKHIWKTTELRNRFDSSSAILDEMRSIRMIELSDSSKMMTPFVGAQLQICEAFGLTVPEECAPGYTSKRVAKRGRKSKAS